MQRDCRIDIIKGLAICLMVLGHCGCPITHFIYLFHMAVFFMASGYVYNKKYSESIDGIKTLFIKRIKSLWIPYFCFNTFFLVIWNPMVNMHISPADLITPLKFVKIMVMNVFMLGSSSVPMCGAFWFLYSLFYITMLYAIVDYILFKINTSHKRVIHLIIASLLFISLYILIKCGFHSALVIKLIGPYIVYALGVELAKQKDSFLSQNNTIFVFIASLLILLVCNDCGTIELAMGEFISPYFYIVASVAGWFFMWTLASRIQKSNLLQKVFVYIGQNTLCIVGIHFIAFKIITFVQIKTFHYPIESLKSYPVLSSSSGWWIAYFVVGITVSLMLNFVYKKTKYTICSVLKRPKKGNVL